MEDNGQVKKFKNGFHNWCDTYFEIVKRIVEVDNAEGTPASKIQAEFGATYWSIWAVELADKFEDGYNFETWENDLGSDYYEALSAWLDVEVGIIPASTYRACHVNTKETINEYEENDGKNIYIQNNYHSVYMIHQLIRKPHKNENASQEVCKITFTSDDVHSIPTLIEMKILEAISDLDAEYSQDHKSE